jgi:PAS domain S-box-containing protein
MRVVSFWNGLEHAEPFEYPLDGTPCGVGIEEAECFYPEGVQDRFPLDDALVRLGVNCYLGVRLHSSKGEPLGLLTVMDARPIGHEATARAALRIFAARAGAELERSQAIRELERSRERFAKAFRSNPLAVAITRRADGRILNVNDALCELFGYTQKEMAGRTTVEMGFWVNAPERERAVALLRDSGTVHGVEQLIRRKSGETRVVQNWIEPIELEGGPCLLGSMLDVRAQARRGHDREARARAGRVVERNLHVRRRDAQVRSGQRGRAAQSRLLDGRAA